MADQENKKTDKKSGVEKHMQNILELIGGTAAIDTYIQGFNETSDKKMTEDQKQFMRTYTLQVAEKWSETIYKMEEALQSPDVVDALEKKLKTVKPRKKQE